MCADCRLGACKTYEKEREGSLNILRPGGLEKEREGSLKILRLGELDKEREGSLKI